MNVSKSFRNIWIICELINCYILWQISQTMMFDNDIPLARTVSHSLEYSYQIKFIIAHTDWNVIIILSIYSH